MPRPRLLWSKPVRVLHGGVWFLFGLVSACSLTDPFHTDFDAIEPAVMYQAAHLTPAAEPNGSLLVMTYNIKFGSARLRFFFECDGTRGVMSEDEVIGNLAGLAGKINQAQPDVLLLQEVDVGSKRTAYVDQVQWLLDHTHLNYGAYASQWRADFVPTDGVGRVDSGNAVLSRWPIHEAERLALAQSRANSAVVNYFYLKRNILRGQVTVGERDLWFLAMHAEAFSDDDIRKEHIAVFSQLLTELDAQGAHVVAGGDFNTIPPGSMRLSGFPDDCADGRYDNDDYTGEEHYLDTLYAGFSEAISLPAYQADNTPYFSFTGDAASGWNRRLDYLFTNGSFVLDSGLVHQGLAQGGYDTLPLSDHAPVSAQWVVP